MDAVSTAAARATAGISRFLGMWQTHPYGPAQPSHTDEAGMKHLVLPTRDAPPRALILIADGPTWQDWLEGADQPHWYTRLVERTTGTAPVGQTPQPTTTKLRTPKITWWPGGYATEPYPTPTDPPKPSAKGHT